MDKLRIELLVLLLLTILSCKSDNEILEEESAGILESKDCQLEEIHHNEGVIKLFYDESDRLISTEKHKAFTYQEKTNIFYNNEDQIERIEVLGQDYQVKENQIFIYTNNLLTKIEHFDKQEVEFRSTIFKYDETERLTLYSGNPLGFSVEYSIDTINIQYSNGGQIIIEEYTKAEGAKNWTNLKFSGGEWDCGINICYSNKYLIEYDDKPFEDDKMFHLAHLPFPNVFNNKNNVLGLDSENTYPKSCSILGHYPGNEGNISSLKNAFEYNEYGYLSSYVSGITNTEQKYIYECE